MDTHGYRVWMCRGSQPPFKVRYKEIASDNMLEAESVSVDVFKTRNMMD